MKGKFWRSSFAHGVGKEEETKLSLAEGEKWARYTENITDERPENVAGFPVPGVTGWASMGGSDTSPDRPVPSLLFSYSSSDDIVPAPDVTLQKPWALQ